MILSASRRTDIPAFYSNWLLKRLEEGFIDINISSNINNILLNKDNIDCIVFWTKNPELLTDHLKKFQEKDIPFYFQFTLTSYNNTIEKNVPKKRYILEQFYKLSKLIGKEKIIWRYDPIFITPEIDLKYHIKYFNLLCTKLKDYTEKCVVSFLEPYKKLNNNIKKYNIIPVQPDRQNLLLKTMANIANENKIELQSCSQKFEKIGITRSKCIDDELIHRITGKTLSIKKDLHQRKLCNCIESLDIGNYNSCLHKCVYCYANKHTIDPKIIDNINKTTFS